MKLQLLTLMAIAVVAASEAILPRAALPLPVATITDVAAAAKSTDIDGILSSANAAVSSANVAVSSLGVVASSVCSSLSISQNDCSFQISNGKTIVNGKTIGGSKNAAPTPAPVAKAGAAMGILGAVAGGLLL